MAIPDPRRLLGVISPLIVWAVWFVFVYGLTGVGCDAAWDEVALPAGNALSLLMLISALLALGLIGGCAWRGYGSWRGNRSVADTRDREAMQRGRFLGLMMLLASLLAAIGILLGSLPIFMLDPCAA